MVLNPFYSPQYVRFEQLAPAYDSTATYSIGDYVTYEYNLYQCTTAVTTAGAFDPSKWNMVDVTDQLTDDLTIASSITGINPNITDSADGYVQDVKVYGESRVSKNLFDKTKVIANQRVSTANGGMYASDGWSAVNPRIDIEPNTAYMITAGTGTVCYVAFYQADDTFISGMSWASGSSRTSPANAYKIRFDFPSANIDTVQFEKGETPTQYEPYFSGIHGIGEDGELEIATYGTGFTPTLTQGTYANDNGQITVISTRVCTDNFYHVSPSAKYKVFASTGETSKTIRLSINYWINDSHSNNQKISATEWQDSGYSFTPPSNCNYISIVTSYTDGSAIAPIDISVGINDLITATVTTGIPLYSVGDVKDELDVKKGVVIKRCGAVDLGNLGWGYNAQNQVFIAYINSTYTRTYTGAEGMCVEYPVDIEHTVSNLPDKHSIIGCAFVASNAGSVVIKNLDYTDRNTFTAAVTGVKLLYILENPYEISLTDTELAQLRNLRTYNPVTNVTITDDPFVNVGYLLNTDNGQAVADIQNELSRKLDDVEERVPEKIEVNTTQTRLSKDAGLAEDVTWNGLTIFEGVHIWTDGTNIYCSLGSSGQYILDKSTLTWSTKTWTGLTSFLGTGVWTDGDNIYCSSGTNQYILDSSTSTWSAKTWTGLTDFIGQFVWTDGENIYYSSGSTQYVLDKSTSTWSAKTWTGLTNFDGMDIWTDGENIYYSHNYDQYVLDKYTSTWSTKTWAGLTGFSGRMVWTDGENIYFSYQTYQYVLDKSTSTWSAKVWNGLSSFSGSNIWTDGENIYYSSAGDNKRLIPNPPVKSVRLR